MVDGNKIIEVFPFHNSYESMRVPIAMVATKWVDPKTGQSHIVIMHQTLYFGDGLDESLLNPNQLHANGLIVEDVPCQYKKQLSHSIFIPTSGMTIPLSMDGVVSRFETMKPTSEEYHTLPQIELTEDVP
jgi:hypothetical protein